MRLQSCLKIVNLPTDGRGCFCISLPCGRLKSPRPSPLYPNHFYLPLASSMGWLCIKSMDTDPTKAVQALDQVKKSILVQCYTMSFNSVGRALLNAKKRGVDVKVILDKSNKTENFCQAASILATAGIPTYIDTTGKLSLRTVMVLDGDTVIDGYFSFPREGENSTDCFAVYSQAPEMVARSTTSWFTKLEHSENYVPEKHIIRR